MDKNEILQQVILNNSVKDYLIFISLVLTGLIFRKLISKSISHFVFRLLNKNNEIDIKAFNSFLVKPLSFFTLLIFVYFACQFIEYPSQLDFAKEGELGIKAILSYSLSILYLKAFIRIGLGLADYLGLILTKRAEKTPSKMDDQIVPFAIDFAKIAVYILGVFYLLGNVFNIDVTTLAAGLGIGGLAIAMASKESLENLLGSFTIFFDKPFTVGDVISIGAITGTVEKVGFRSTRIKTFDRSIVTVPNKNLISAELDNLGLRKVRRAKFMIGLTYDSTTEQIKSVVNDVQNMLNEHEMTNDESIVRFQEFGSSSLDILIIFFVNSRKWEDYINTKQDINYKIMEIVESHKCDFAFPSTTVYLQNEK
jgi:MscS family membrane protein